MRGGINKVSIRQPLVLYAMVFMLFVAFVVLTLASFSMIEASRRAYRRASVHALEAMIEARPDLGQLAAEPLAFDDLEVGVVTATRSPFALDLAGARRIARSPKSDDRFVVRPIGAPGTEAYLAGQLDPTVPVSIAFVEISRMVPLVLVGALACAALLAFSIGRLLLPPLDALRELATDPRPLDPADGLVGGPAPTEIHDVARRFRQTVRLLNEERDVVADQKDELERMQESLVRASKLASVGRLAAGIAHEVGNPLAAVKGYLSILRGGLEEPNRSEVLERSVKELDRIHQTILKLLTYARRGEAGAEPKRPFSTRKVLDEALTLVRGHPALRRVELVDEAGGEVGEDAFGQPGPLGQVLVNLLLNAAQAMADVEAPRIRLERREQDRQVVLSVVDNGPGIDPAHLESVFDPFFTTKAPGEGTGLGLAVSRALMEAMGGDLRAIATDGAGARFEVHVPTPRPLSPD